MITSGLYIQLYRGEIHGADPFGQYQRYLDQVMGLGLPGVVIHGFPQEMATNWDRLVKAAHDRRLIGMASWGMDETTDNQGAPFTVEEKAQFVGSVLARSNCIAGLLDAEGLYDRKVLPGGVPTEVGTLRFGQVLRQVAPNALVADQPWFAIESHGDERPVPLPTDKGGTFQGFPSDEFAAYAVNWFRFRQAYCNDFKSQFGESRYAEVFAWMDRDWAVHQAHLKTVGLDRPLGVTIQGYGWRLRDLGHCLLKYTGQLQQPVIMWSEPFPTPDTLSMIKGVDFLARKGYVQPGVDPRDMVRSFQHDYNKLAPIHIDEDGWMGVKTLSTMGIRIESV